MKVFVTQQTKYNLEPAKEFGNLIIMNLWSQPRDITSQYASMIKIMTTHGMLKDDLLLLIGNPILIGLAIHIALRRNGEVKVLVWDKVRYKYEIELLTSEL